MRYGSEYWNTIVDEYFKSGLSQKEYAAQKGLKYPTLSYQVRKHQTVFDGFEEAVNESLIKK